MAQTIHCDNPGCGEVADVIMSNLATGDTKAFCAAHFNEFVVQYCEAIIRAQQAAQAEETQDGETSTPPKNKGRKGPSKQSKANAVANDAEEKTTTDSKPDDGSEVSESEDA